MRYAIACILWLVTTAPLAAQGQSELSESAARDLWQRHWPRFASLYVKIGDKYAACSKYKHDFPSSRHITIEQVREQTVRERVERYGSIMTRRENIYIPREDAEAVVHALPSLAVGEYGYIQAATVVEVLSESAMVVDHVELVNERGLERAKDEARRDLARRSTARGSRRAVETQVEWMFQNRDRLFEQQDERDFEGVQLKLVGFDTRGVDEGDRWAGAGERPAPGVDAPDHGIAIAIVAKEKPPEDESRRRRSRRSRRRDRNDMLVAVPAERLRGREMDEDQFVEMLEQRGYNRDKFVQLVLEQKREHLEEGDERVIQILEAARPQQQAETEVDE